MLIAIVINSYLIRRYTLISATLFLEFPIQKQDKNDKLPEFVKCLVAGNAF